MLRKQRGITVEEIQQALSEEEGMMRTNDKEHPSGTTAYWRGEKACRAIYEHKNKLESIKRNGESDIVSNNGLKQTWTLDLSRMSPNIEWMTNVVSFKTTIQATENNRGRYSQRQTET
ncbi:hypothetical protein HZH66_000845 [Vespula vulgaris]|uniref:Uncharacterized protein n=1 Tax=Vespula vulgaris TaxID=7454 RepID=A0A834NL70_VESVU|nr:hypothetical protein HZH66_000845 [Vespula vulgaris]